MPMPAAEPPMLELFRRFPYESAAALRRNSELTILFSSGLVVHCAIIAWQAAHCFTYVDVLLQNACIVRVFSSIPKPYFWFQKHMRLVQAQNQPTPQLVAQKLHDVPAYVCSTERMFSNFYNVWMACVTIVVSMARFECVHTPVTQLLWQHCLVTLLSMVVQRLICLSVFYRLTQASFQRGITQGVLDGHTKLLDAASVKHGDMECSICLCEYQEGEEVRQLGCCHHFHRRCIDPWLVDHRNSCPLCAAVVGPQR